MTGPHEVRTVLGLAAEAWCLGAAVVVVVAICCDSIGLFLAQHSAVRAWARAERPSSLPSFREARKARSGGWNR